MVMVVRTHFDMTVWRFRVTLGFTEVMLFLDSVHSQATQEMMS